MVLMYSSQITGTIPYISFVAWPLQAVGWFLLMAFKQLYKWAGGLSTFLYTGA